MPATEPDFLPELAEEEPDQVPASEPDPARDKYVPAATPTPVPVNREPLLSAAAESTFLQRWNEIQTGFVEDPAGAAEAADTLAGDIVEAMVQSLQERRAKLAASWRVSADQAGNGAGTEELRQALLGYRAFVSVVVRR